MTSAFILVAFLAGFAARGVGLPPLVGFLAAGFVLNAFGFELTPTLGTIADLGVTLLLFTIGLKLDVRTLLRGEVWGSASLHMAVSTGLFVGALALLKTAGVALLADAGLMTLLLIGFALSFSSTVFAVKVLEDRGETGALYGRLAVGVLIMQDVFAVVFLTASTGALPSVWALALLALIPLAPLLRLVLGRVGHGELQVLYGVMLALVLGFALFESVGIKGDLGALIVGMLLAPHSAASGLARSLFNLKELFLVGFFLTIGLTALPGVEHVWMTLLLVLVLPLKSALFLALFRWFRLRNRTAVLSSLALSNYSEFGLIVAALATANGWMPADWLVILSLAVAVSFALAAPLNDRSEAIYRWLGGRLPPVDPERLHPDDRRIDLAGVDAVVLGMGKIGRGAYARLHARYGLRVLGVDNETRKVERLRRDGFRVLEGDAVDSDFWERLLVTPEVRLVLLAMPHRAGNLYALEQLRGRDFPGRIAAIVEYPDDIEPLKRRGADAVFHVYEEAGLALADSAVTLDSPAER